jgi:predicted RNase H-like nuclease (RuvC/YqgF family)
MINYSIS